MAYHVVDTALATTNTALYIFVADTVNDLDDLPNMTKGGDLTVSARFAQPGSCVRVVGAGRWYILNASNVWKAMYYMNDEVQDAVEKNVDTMKGYMDNAESYKNSAATSAENAGKSEAAAAVSETNAGKSANNASNSLIAVEASQRVVADNLQQTVEARTKAQASEEAAAASALICAGYEGNTKFGMALQEDGSVLLVYNDEE